MGTTKSTQTYDRLPASYSPLRPRFYQRGPTNTTRLAPLPMLKYKIPTRYHFLREIRSRHRFSHFGPICILFRGHHLLRGRHWNKFVAGNCLHIFISMRSVQGMKEGRLDLNALRTAQCVFGYPPPVSLNISHICGCLVPSSYGGSEILVILKISRLVPRICHEGAFI